MPYRGKPSKNCGPCRKRKIKCDLKLPGCTQCSNAGLECPGYRNQLDLMFLDENERTERSVLKRSSSRKSSLKPASTPAASRRPSPSRAVTTNSIPAELEIVSFNHPAANRPPVATRASQRRKARTATPEEVERMEVSRRRAVSQADVDRKPMTDYNFGANFMDPFGNLATPGQSELKLDTHQGFPNLDTTVANRAENFFTPNDGFDASSLDSMGSYSEPQYDFNMSIYHPISFNLVNPTPITPGAFTSQQLFPSQSNLQQVSQQAILPSQSMPPHQQVMPQTIPGHAMSRSSIPGAESTFQNWGWAQSAPPVLGSQNTQLLATQSHSLDAQSQSMGMQSHQQQFQPQDPSQQQHQFEPQDPTQHQQQQQVNPGIGWRDWPGEYPQYGEQQQQPTQQQQQQHPQ